MCSVGLSPGVGYIFVLLHQGYYFYNCVQACTGISTNQYLLLPSTSILHRLSAIPQARNNNIKIHLEDLWIYNTLEESSRQLEATVKLFTKRGKGKVAQEVELNEEDEE